MDFDPTASREWTPPTAEEIALWNQHRPTFDQKLATAPVDRRSADDYETWLNYHPAA